MRKLIVTALLLVSCTTATPQSPSPQATFSEALSTVAARVNTPPSTPEDSESDEKPVSPQAIQFTLNVATYYAVVCGHRFEPGEEYEQCIGDATQCAMKDPMSLERLLNCGYTKNEK